MLHLKPLSPTILLNLYKVYVLPITDYCSISFNVCSKSLLDRLDHMHYKAMKYLTSTRSGTSGTTNTNSLAPPSVRRKYFTAIQTYKILYGLSPSYLLSSVKYFESISHRTLRNQYRVRVPPIRSNYVNYGKKSFYFTCTGLWNNLTQDYLYCVKH